MTTTGYRTNTKENILDNVIKRYMCNIFINLNKTITIKSYKI